MNAVRAMLAGLTAGAVMSIVLALARIGGVPVNLELILATFCAPPSAFAWGTGLVISLALSGLVAFAYVWAFENVTGGSTPLKGMLLSLPHFAVTGLLIGLLPHVHPRIPSEMPAPGAFMLHHGALAVAALALAHLAFGAAVGFFYQPTQEHFQSINDGLLE